MSRPVPKSRPRTKRGHLKALKLRLGPSAQRRRERRLEQRRLKSEDDK